MGPFTEALVYALQNSTGEILDVYAIAAKKTAEISPGQEPVMYRSKTVERVVLTRETPKQQDHRAKELLVQAEGAYRARAWEEFRATVSRGKALASEPQLQQRLTMEIDFANFVMSAESAESERKWQEAAAQWQKAGQLFRVREWVLMKAAVAWLLADDVVNSGRVLATLAAQSDSEIAQRAKRVLAELAKSFPSLEAEAAKIAHDTERLAAAIEFEKIQDEH
jgi:hypothetical protein